MVPTSCTVPQCIVPRALIMTEPFKHRALQTLSKNSLNTMGRLVGLGARQWEAIWAIPGGEAGIWGMGEDRR